MEEAHKLHKDRPFGWVLMMQEMVRAVAAQPVTPRVEKTVAPAPLDDLHNLAAPH